MSLGAFRENASDVTDLNPSTQPIISLDQDDELDPPSKGLKAVFDEKRDQDFTDLQREIALGQGQLSFDQISRIINAARTKYAIQLQQSRKAKEQLAERLHRLLLDQLQQQIDAVDRAIEGHRGYFANKYGEQWRETLGRSILGDDMPERRAGESDADYNERVEDAIFDRVCNPDGSLREGFEGHPDADRLEQWGKDRVRKQRLENGIEQANNAQTAEEKLEIVEETLADADIKDAWMVAAGIDGHEMDSSRKHVENSVETLLDTKDQELGTPSGNEDLFLG